jgi:hypothetical protein
MNRIALSDAVALIRHELHQAMATPDATGLRFPVGEITLSFQVGLTRSGSGSAGLQLWVFELGADKSFAKETVQTVTIVLEPPVTADGEPIKVASSSDKLPD